MGPKEAVKGRAQMVGHPGLDTCWYCEPLGSALAHFQGLLHP